jgi:hypothetical protein
LLEIKPTEADMPGAWNGEERRKGNRDHDTLIEVVQILQNHVENDTKNWARFDVHTAEDKQNFTTVTNKVDKHAMYIYMAIGAIGLLEILFGLHK